MPCQQGTSEADHYLHSHISFCHTPIHLPNPLRCGQQLAMPLAQPLSQAVDVTGDTATGILSLALKYTEAPCCCTLCKLDRLLFVAGV